MIFMQASNSSVSQSSSTSSTSSLPPGSLSAQVPKLFKSTVEPAFPSTQTLAAPAAEEPTAKQIVAISEGAPAAQVGILKPLIYENLAVSSVFGSIFNLATAKLLQLS